MTVEQIHQAAYNRGGWLLAFEGVRQMFTNIGDLIGSGAASWIGTDYGDREVKLGLVVPSEIPLGETDPWAGKIVQPRAVNFGLLDFDGTVVELFKNFEPDQTTDSMGERLGPLDDPAPAVTPGPAQTPLDLWGRHIGTEAIGPAGERRYYWLAPDDVPPGLDHFAGVGWPPSLITNTPTVWSGRKAALYRIVYDDAAGGWPSWIEQYEGGSLWWYGTVKDRGGWRDSRQGRVLSVACIGSSSWLRKSANLSRPTRWLRPQGGVVLTGDRAKVAAWIENDPWLKIGGGVSTAPGTFRAQTLASGNTLAGLTTREEIWERIGDIVETMISGADTGVVLAASNATWVGPDLADAGPWQLGLGEGRDVSVSSDGSTIRIQCEAQSEPNPDQGYAIGLSLDATVWQIAGWDINAPGFNRLFGTCPVGGPTWGGQVEDQKLPGFHYNGVFRTRASSDAPQSEWTNNGQWQQYDAPWQAGTVTLDHAGGNELRLGVGTVRCEGQFAQPWTKGATIDGDQVSASGWWVFRGQRITAEAYEAGGDPEDYMQVAFCEWVATPAGDAIDADSKGYARIRILRWEDPRRWGVPFDKMTEPWVSVIGGLECAPIGVLGGTVTTQDWRHRLIPRILLSTGTATWDDSGDKVIVDPGVNHPASLPPGEPWPGDMEAADLGCGIPAVYVDHDTWRATCASLPGGTAGALNRVRYPVFGSHRMEHILVEAMAGAGLGWTWKRKAGEFVPAFGCYDPIAPLALGQVEVTLTRPDMAETSIGNDEQWRGIVDLRDGGPYDRFEYAVDRNPMAGSTLNYAACHESQDYGRRYRDGSIDWDVNDGGMRDPGPWRGTPYADIYSWEGHARTRFAVGFGPRHARQVRIYRNTYNGTFAGRIGLGTIVHVIDPTAEAGSGERGINHLGRVIRASIVARGPGTTAVRVAVELEPEAVDQIKVWGPSAQGGVGSWDAGTNTLTVTADWSKIGNGHDDTTGFVQPEWDTHTGGPLRVAIYQSETGKNYPAAYEVRADVVSVDAGAHTIELTNITGRIFRDMIKWVVAAPYDEQSAEWALAIYMPITEPTGLWNGVDNGYRL